MAIATGGFLGATTSVVRTRGVDTLIRISFASHSVVVDMSSTDDLEKTGASGEWEENLGDFFIFCVSLPLQQLL